MSFRGQPKVTQVTPILLPKTLRPFAPLRETTNPSCLPSIFSRKVAKGANVETLASSNQMRLDASVPAKRYLHQFSPEK